MGQFWVILANQLAYSGEGVTTWFFFLLFTTNQYKAATELQTCIVPTDFRILCNGPSAAAGEGADGLGALSHLHQRPGSNEPCRLNHDHYLGKRALAGASQKVLFTVITAPGQAVWAEARRLGLESTQSLHLCLIYPVSLIWEGRAKKERLLQTPIWASHFRQSPGALTLQTQASQAPFAFATSIEHLSFKVQLKNLPLWSFPEILTPVSWPIPVLSCLGYLKGKWEGSEGKALEAPMSAGIQCNVPVHFKLSGLEEWPAAINPIQSNSSFYTYRYGSGSKNISLEIDCFG